MKTKHQLAMSEKGKSTPQQGLLSMGHSPYYMIPILTITDQHSRECSSACLASFKQSF